MNYFVDESVNDMTATSVSFLFCFFLLGPAEMIAIWFEWIWLTNELYCDTFHSFCCWWLWSGQYWLGGTVVISHRLHQWRRTLLKYSCVLKHQWVLKVRILKYQHLLMCKEPYKSIQVFGDLFIEARLCICVSINWDGSASCNGLVPSRSKAICLHQNWYIFKWALSWLMTVAWINLYIVYI